MPFWYFEISRFAEEYDMIIVIDRRTLVAETDLSLRIELHATAEFRSVARIMYCVFISIIEHRDI
jgi:hypothetical protein